jgi:hypothetical protein
MLVFFLRLPTDIQNKLGGEDSEVFFNTRTAYDNKVFVFLSALFSPWSITNIIHRCSATFYFLRLPVLPVKSQLLYKIFFACCASKYWKKCRPAIDFSANLNCSEAARSRFELGNRLSWDITVLFKNHIKFLRVASISQRLFCSLCYSGLGLSA